MRFGTNKTPNQTKLKKIQDDGITSTLNVKKKCCSTIFATRIGHIPKHKKNNSYQFSKLNLLISAIS